MYYNLDMTLVIACKSKDGIVVASDGYGAEIVPGMAKTGRHIDNAKKIFDFNQACILAFGDGKEDYDEFFNDLVVSRNEPITYEFLFDNLIDYLGKKYDDDIYFADTIGLVLAGIDRDGEQHISTFLSKTHLGVGFQVLKARKDFLCAGRHDIANRLFDTQTNLAQKNASEVAALASKAIAKTSRRWSDVNDNVVMKLISNNGIKSLDSNASHKAL